MSLEHALNILRRDADRVIETSCATVVLKGDKAFKLKKSVDYGFLDFTDADKRRHALEAELRYNKRTAADIYDEVIEIGGESVLVMRRFDTACVLGESAARSDWTPDLGQMDDLGEAIADFHAGAEVCHDPQHAENIRYTIDSNDANIGRVRAVLGAEAVDAYHDELYAELARQSAVVGVRFGQGLIRRCHGDLHLGNILIEKGRPVLFDCIEFNEKLSQIDVLYDLAFLLMDLWVKGYTAAANRVLNAWLERVARRDDEAALYGGLSLLPLHMSVRAGVRCHVTANAGEPETARMYLAAAREFLRPVPASVLAVGGLSGSGKSTRARALAPGRGRAPGAVTLRSDELRKRLWRHPSREPLPRAAYDPAETGRTYAHMFGLGDTVLGAGQAVVFDATFREPGFRTAAESVASVKGAAFDGLWLSLPAEERARRVAARSGDVSDATASVASAQAEIDPATITWQIEGDDFAPADPAGKGDKAL
ncbi:bifunctional aminoglycoside phosphotransferase/ATP-binding protein [Asticcacaulis solisilvae]|uniref:bifunctional aminoglycoside phosphotransferase/ATP-binding protein n=1 Tax=Asticcacaulis solisilvae TaxID=1217274 RepID=UPI003FD85107